MISTKSVANAFSGKTARPCDSCIKKRARWYCAADDAFLCQACDSSVHSANPLARRHERVRLKTASFKLLSGSERTSPSWHKGFTKKARTRRSPKGWKWKTNPVPFVPEVGADEISHEENEEEQLLYRVPIFDPFVAELCGNAAMADEKSEPAAVTAANSDKSWNKAAIFGQDGDNKLRGFFPSDLELVDFAADVESMLGKGLEDQSFGMEDLGLVDSEEKDVKVAVKVEKDDQCEESSRESRGGEPDRMELDVDCRETFELNFDYDSPASCGEDDERLVKEEEEKVDSGWPGEGGEEENSGKGRRKVLLSLDYEGVIGAWASRGSPWTTEERPEIDPGECLLNFWVVGGKGMSLAAYGEFGGMGMAPAIGADGGREARVSRYREKRRTRLFSKKIRYEVRKLNAEKRPRMKGRFVKRVSYGAPSNSFALS